MLNFISGPSFISVFLLMSGLINYENFSDRSELFLGKLWRMCIWRAGP